MRNGTSATHIPKAKWLCRWQMRGKLRSTCWAESERPWVPNTSFVCAPPMTRQDPRYFQAKLVRLNVCPNNSMTKTRIIYISMTKTV